MKQNRIFFSLILLLTILGFLWKAPLTEDTKVSAASKKVLPNASFRIKDSINPWNFTLTVSCSRILLKSEIKGSKLTIIPKKKTKPKLTASFLKLSSNGKKVTYRLQSSSQKTLCPGDSSMDGTYLVTCSRFKKTLSLTYHERLPKNTLSGFVLQQDGSPIPKAKLLLKTASGKKQCITDKNGHYQFKSIKKARSLTVSKKGFYSTTLDSIVSSNKGVSCENVILRAKNNSAVSIEFLVTDTDNQPIPNASVFFVTKKTASTSAVEESTIYSDSIPKEQLLFSETTDSLGTLLFSNQSLSAQTPKACSSFTITKQTQLSYLSSFLPAAKKQVILGKKLLTPSKEYDIYISKTSSDQTSPAYYAQKLSFSFSSLSTNHAFFHVQLSACPSLTIQSLSLPCEADTLSSNDTSLSLRFFSKKQREAFFEYQITDGSFQMKADNLFLPYLELPISLFDDTYYLQIQAYNNENTLLAESCIVPVSIAQSCLSCQTIYLQKPHFARILAYGSLQSRQPQMVSFSLYQKADDNYFLVDSVSTDLFTPDETYFFTSQLLLSHLCVNQNYLFVSTEKDIAIKKPLLFTANQENIFLTKKEALLSPVPLAQIACGSQLSCNLTDYFPSERTISFSYPVSHEITTDFVRAHAGYLNCVIAFYHSDGTLITTTLTSKPSQNHLPSLKKSSIIDIYTNKEILTTNQDSYQ